MRSHLLFILLLPAGLISPLLSAAEIPPLRLEYAPGDSATYQVLFRRLILNDNQGPSEAVVAGGTCSIRVLSETPTGARVLEAVLSVGSPSGGEVASSEGAIGPAVSATMELTLEPNGTWERPLPTTNTRPPAGFEDALRSVLWGLYVCLPVLPSEEETRSLPRPLRWATNNGWGGEGMEAVSEPREGQVTILGITKLDIPDSSTLSGRITADLRDGRVIDGQMTRLRRGASGDLMYKDLIDVTLVDRVP